MTRQAAKYPRPKASYHRGTWVIYWNFLKDRYTLYPGRQDPDDPEVEADLRRVAAALAMASPVFPPEWADAPGVVRYLKKRFRMETIEKAPPKPPEEVLADYELDLKRHCRPRWAAQSMATVRDFDAFARGFGGASPLEADGFLASILDRGQKPATRNRALAICSRFFNWCLRSGHLAANPFSGLKSIAEPDIEEIVYCAGSERGRVVAAAMATGRPDWIAVPIALYAGCRREEIFNLQWTDINLGARRLAVRKSKTGKKRSTPIARELAAILEKAAKDRGPVVPRMPGESWANQADRLVELVRERLCRPVNPDRLGRAREAVGKRRFAMTEEELAALAGADGRQPGKPRRDPKKMRRGDAKEQETAGDSACPENRPAPAADGGDWMPAERLGWNAWRHTFATLRAQAGVSLDKISSWMGNTCDVCRKHYTQFVPRDAADEDIDR